jgi:hypothetical protein
VFAPIPVLLERCNEKALFEEDPPYPESLAWHYNMCVFENMCALSLQEAGGAKRIRQPGPSKASIEADQTEEPSPNTTTAQPDEETMHAEQGNAAGVVSSAYISGHRMAGASMLDAPESSEDEDYEDWQHDFSMELDHRLRGLVDAY